MFSISRNDILVVPVVVFAAYSFTLSIFLLILANTLSYTNKRRFSDGEFELFHKTLSLFSVQFYLILRVKQLIRNYLEILDITCHDCYGDKQFYLLIT